MADGQGVIERLALEHPLPEEIRTMERDETVCQFCGVSYLIHREVKALEDQLAKVRQELARYEGSEEREQRLREELERARRERDAGILTAQEQDATIKRLMKEVELKDGQIRDLAEDNQGLQRRMEEEAKSTNQIRNKQEFLSFSLPLVHSSIQRQRLELDKIRASVQEMGQAVKESSDQVTSTVQAVCSQEAKETSRLREELGRLEREKVSVDSGRAEMERSLQSAQAEAARVSQTVQQLNQAEEQNRQLASHIERLQTELDDAISKERSQKAEAAQMRGLLTSMSQEVEDLKAQQLHHKTISEQLSTKLQQELKQRGAELQTALANYRQLQGQVRDQEAAEAEIQRQAALSMGETDHIRQALLKAQEECNALKAERDLMISSHQNRIEQLRESFKQKLNDAERWPDKMEDILQKERTRHGQEMQQLEEKLKETFHIELDIERQRHQELTERYKAEYHEKEAKLKSELRGLSTRHKAELSQVERQASSLRTQASAGEEALRREVQGLKGVITDLEHRLGQAGTESDALVIGLRAELREAEQDLTASREENRVIGARLAQSREEILFLQETVRRECEERYELTELLSETKEQLLAYQRHGGLAGGSRPGSAAAKPHKPESGFGSTPGAGGGSSGRKSSAGSAPPAVKHPGNAGPTSPGLVASSNIKIGFDAGQARPPAGRPKDGSMSDSRQRINAAIGRR